MDLEYIKRMVGEIHAKRGDPGEAHRMEDRLHRHFIRLVGEVGTPKLAEMAREVMKTSEIKFHRWYA